MTPDTTAPADPLLPPPAGDQLSVSRQLALGLLLVALLLLGGAGYYGYRAYTVSKATPAETKEAEPKPADLAKPTDPSFASYVFNAFLFGMAGLTTAAGGLNRFARLPLPDPGEEAVSNRLALLVVGLFVGVLIAFGGLWHFAANAETLTKWLDGRETTEKWRPLAALLACVVGCGVAFLCALPARGSERTDQLSRRLIYGSNVAVAGLLLFLLLVIGNVIAGAKLPNRLDTTNEGFFSIDPSTARYLKDLDAGSAVTAHVMFDEGDSPTSVAAKRLLGACAEAAPDRFSVKYYQPTMATVQQFKTKFPLVDPAVFGVILAVGEDQAKYAQVPLADFVKTEGRGKASFNGEAAVMKEVKFLTEGGDKSVLYVTQGSGELPLAPAGGQAEVAGGPRGMSAVKRYLEGLKVEVKPLAFGPGTPPAIPADATAVFVADPQSPLPPAAVAALEAYYTGPPGGKKGKLIVASGPGATTGLEGLLAGAGVRLEPAYLYFQPTQQRPPTIALGAVTRAADDGKIGPAKVFVGSPVQLPDCRPLTIAPADPNSPAPAGVVPLFVTRPGAITWQEAERSADPFKTFEQLVNDKLPEQTLVDLVNRTKASQQPRVLAAAVTEGTTGRLLVVGSGAFFGDDAARRAGQTPPAGQFLAASVDWFRERKDAPSVLTKPYGEYTLPETASGFQLVLLPLALAALAIFAVGGGVWAVRRK